MTLLPRITLLRLLLILPLCLFAAASAGNTAPAGNTALAANDTAPVGNTALAANDTAPAGDTALAANDTAPRLTTPLLHIPAGTFVMGDPAGDANEAPREVTLRPFRLMKLEVTVEQFAAFVAATGHRSDAERSGSGYVWDGRWRRVAGANWRRPFPPRQPGGGENSQPRHPVVQVSARDAAAFCAFHGLRLPREEEWEFAARGTDGRRYPWGNALPVNRGKRTANFGTVACCAPDDADGYNYLAPVGSYAAGASPFGVLDMAGNVWEWTASVFPGRPGEVVLRGGGWGNNPYCLRAAYRHGNPPDIGLNMVGFRCAGDATPQ